MTTGGDSVPRHILLCLLFLATLLSPHDILGPQVGSRAEARLWGKDVRIEVEWITDPAKEESGFVYGPGDFGRRLTRDGISRFYEIHVPASYTKKEPIPAVLVFHGGGGDPGTVRYESQMDRTSDRENFIVVYPAGTNKRRLILKDRLLLWNDGRPYKDGSYSKVDDVGYVKALLDDLARLFNIDSNRIYACGFSNGAQFTYRLAKRLPDRIAAIAVVAGQRPAHDAFDPAPSRPISVMQFAGLEDGIAPYEGGKGPSRAAVQAVSPPVRETIKSWAEFNGCPPEPAEVKRIGKAVMNRYGPCQADSEVILWTLEDGGHAWPGGNMFPGVELLGLGELGEVNRDIHASDLMWKFFKKHPLK